MKFKTAIRSAFAFGLLGLLSAAPLSSRGGNAAFSMSEEGVDIRFGDASPFNLSFPKLLNGSNAEIKLAEKKLASPSACSLKYDDGTAIELNASGPSLNVKFASLGSGASSFKMESMIQFSPALLSKWKAGSGDWTAFPETKPAKPFLYQGNCSDFAFQSQTGKAFALRIPDYSYQQLQDNREWNWKIFVWWFSSPINRDNPDFALTLDGAAAAPSSSADAPAKSSKLIDKFGQFALKDWPGKVHSEEELKADVADEKAYYDSLKPPQFDKYGGLPDSQAKFGFEKTGFFHVERKNGRWRMVDPDGNLFFHLGVCSFLPYSATVYYGGRESVFEWLPPKDGEFKTAFGRNAGGTNEPEFNFQVANMIRKYGKPFDVKEWTSRMIERVRKWGFNSAGAFGYGDETANKEASFPYVSGLPLNTWLGVEHLPGIRETWDPFDEKVRAVVDRNFSKDVAKDADNPLVIGYFLTNEPIYEDIVKVVPTYKGDRACKRTLAKMLQERYKDVASFNEAWGLNAASFDEVRDSGLSVKTKKAAEDMAAFKRLFFETYFKFVSETFRKYDRNHMLLGCRLQSGTINDEDLCSIAAKYVDVWSFNYYTYGLDTAFLDRIYKWTGGKPMILSEFYWNSPSDSGVPGGVKDIGSQLERGLAYRHYVEHAASLDYVVGVEWFTLADNSYLGVSFAKYDGENCNCGLLNIVDRPWKTMLAEMMKTNYRIYDVAAGSAERFVFDDARFNKKGFSKNSVNSSKVKGPLPVNGTADGWPGMPAERIGSDRLVQGSSAEGLEASFKTCWDESFLYVLVDISDSTPMRNDNAPDMLWSGDCVELFIGSESLDKGGPLLFSDRQILLSGSKAAGKASCFYARAPQQYETQMAVVPKPDGKGYALQAAIPWKALDVSPKIGTELIFDIGIDDSPDGKRRDRQIMWNGSATNSGDRSYWGRLRLAGQ